MTLSGPADGGTYDEKRDRGRLDKQRARVYNFMADSQWHTPDDIADATGDDWASAGARMRDLRKPQFGGHLVERKSLGKGLFAYRLARKSESTYDKLKQSLLH